MNSSLPSPVPQLLGPFPVSSLEGLIHGLKRSLAGQLAARYAECLPTVLVERALDDAEELARTTGLPHLFLPVIAEEKLERVSRAVCPKTPQDSAARLRRAA